MTPFDERLEASRRALLGAAAVVPHTDADGLAAGALALRARGEGAEAAVLLGRGSTPFDASFDAPRPVAVLDWGVRRLRGPALFVDHHAPEARPEPGQLVVSGYGEDPETTSSCLVRRLVPEQPSWLAAIGAVGDLGDRAWRLPECSGAPRALTRRLASLVNAPRRVPAGPVRAALAVMVESDDPRSALADPRIDLLEAAHSVWRDGLAAALRTAPRVDRGVALIRLTSTLQVHPVVATVWARRLAPNLVLAANDGYLPGRVNFAVRGGEGDLRRRLVAALPEATGELGHGHDRATGGSLVPEEFERLLRALRCEGGG